MFLGFHGNGDGFRSVLFVRKVFVSLRVSSRLMSYLLLRGRTKGEEEEEQLELLLLLSVQRSGPVWPQMEGWIIQHHIQLFHCIGGVCWNVMGL